MQSNYVLVNCVPLIFKFDHVPTFAFHINNLYTKCKYTYLTIIPRMLVGYKLLDSGRGCEAPSRLS